MRNRLHLRPRQADDFTLDSVFFLIIRQPTSSTRRLTLFPYTTLFRSTFQYLTGLPSFPDPQTLRRFLLNAPERLWQQLHALNDRLLQHFIHKPDRRSRLIFDLDSTVVTVFGHQEE